MKRNKMINKRVKVNRKLPRPDYMDLHCRDCVREPPPPVVRPPDPMSVTVGHRFTMNGTFQSAGPCDFMWQALIGVSPIASGIMHRNDPETCIRDACLEVAVTCDAIHARRVKS